MKKIMLCLLNKYPCILEIDQLGQEKKDYDDVVFVKQVLMHPRDRLARAPRKK